MKLLDISTRKYPNTFTMVDDSDFEFLSQWKWFAQYPIGRKTMYAVRNTSGKGGKARKILRMHRAIMNPKDTDIIDHADRNGLNNTRGNLRVCTPNESARNRTRPQSAKGSPYRGVFLRKRWGTFQAHIGLNGWKIHLGFFKTAEAAALAYNEAAIKYHGEFASINEVTL